MRMLGLVVLFAVAGCNQRQEIQLRYQLGTLMPADVVRLETVLDIDASDGRTFTADQPYRQVATGVGYEVRDLDGSGRRKVLITHDGTIGYEFAKTFVFTLLPPVTGPAPKLSVSARAAGVSDTLATTSLLSAAFGKGASIDVTLTDQRCDGVRVCNGNETCCPGSGCVRLDGDAANCGGCGMSCGANQACSGSACRCNSGSGCEGGTVCCAGQGCADLQNDSANCGGCGIPCHPGETCVGGACKCNGGAACAAAEICCAGGSCSSAGCACGGNTCTGTQKCCGGSTCLDVANDNNNCGACGKVCPTGLACAGGKCKCQGFVCSGADACCSTGCANLQNDNVNCGMCGHGCNLGETCVAGACQCNGTACTTKEPVCCGAGAAKACTNTDADIANCGSCGTTCAAFESCTSGHCICAGTRHCLGTESCCTAATTGQPGCFDLSSDLANCGQCGKTCSTGQACQSGVCKTVSGCICTNGNSCSSSGGATQACMCGTNAACTGTQYCCGNTCVDRQSDMNNCGGCGNSCEASSQLCCSGACIYRDLQHCASCTDACQGGGVSQCCACGDRSACRSNLALCLPCSLGK